MVNSLNINKHATIVMDGTMFEDVKTCKYIDKHGGSSENEI